MHMHMCIHNIVQSYPSQGPGKKKAACTFKTQPSVAKVVSAPANRGEGTSRNGDVASNGGGPEVDAPNETDIKELLDAGLLSQEEYDTRKVEIVRRAPSLKPPPARF